MPRPWGPLKLSIPLGDHQCYAYLPDGDGNTVRLPGILTLKVGQGPRAELHGDIPFEQEEDSLLGTVKADFPQITRAASLRVDLVLGLDVLLLDCVIDVWFPGRIAIRAGLAVVGHIPSDLPSIEFTEATLQVSGLDSVIGRAPLERTQFPVKRLPDQPMTWSATERLSARDMVSSDDCATVGAHWFSSYSAGDGYQTRVLFSPVVSIELATPAGVTAFLQDWVYPIRRLVGLSTGRPESITHLVVRLSEPSGPGPELQAFGPFVDQTPYSEEAEVRRRRPAFRCYEDREEPTTFLQLCRRWQRAEADHHPLIETIGAFLLLPPQHPRPRFLLLIQALEGLYYHDHEEELDEDVKRHQEKRTVARDYIRSCDGMDPSVRRFLLDNVPNRPASNLGTVLAAVVADLPDNELEGKLQALEIVQLMIADPLSNAHSWGSALRIIRNELSHGRRGWDARLLRPAADLLERCTTAHLLRFLAISEAEVKAYLSGTGDR